MYSKGVIIRQTLHFQFMIRERIAVHLHTKYVLLLHEFT